MMPRSSPPCPADQNAMDCLGKARSSKIAWKRFRESECGKVWWNYLSEAYEYRCVYCDHAPCRTVDHFRAKANEGKSAVFGWDNWRAACGDCNRLKGQKRPFDPVKEDPYSGLGFDAVTGRPFVRPGCKRTQRSRATSSIELGLDNQTLNDARREIVRQFVEILISIIEKRKKPGTAIGFLRSKRRANRAVLRDLILQPDDTDEGVIVHYAITMIDGLVDWARDPVGGSG